MRKTATIHDIARQAGVSPSTVSRVLNGTSPVAADKRAAVLAVIDQLNYRPNLIAQGLKWGRSFAVGVLTQSIASPFYNDIVRGIEQGLANQAHRAVIASGNWRADEELAALDLLAARRVDGLIVLPGATPAERLRQAAGDLPLVVVGRSIAGLEAQSLGVDNQRAAYGATNYLIELGHQRIAHIAGPSLHQDAIDRQVGYQQALSDIGLPADPRLVVEGDYTERAGLLAVQTLLSRGVMFSAIFASNDQMAYGARLALYRHGIRVPEDVSLIGFDDQPGSAYATPPLTTVRQPTFDMGLAAAETVLALLRGAPVSPPQFATELIIRESAALRRGP